MKEFSQTLERLENTSGRNDMTEILAEFLPKLTGAEIKQAMYLMHGRLVPSYIDLEFNFSRKLAMRGLAMILEPKVDDIDVAEKQIKQEFEKLGDLGLVAEKLVGKSKSKKTISEVFESLKKLAELEGKGSQDAKIIAYKELIASLDPISARYVTRVIVGSLRLGLSNKTVQDALSWSVTGDKSLRPQVERAYGARSDIGEIAQIVLTTPKDKLESALAKIKIVPGVPVASKLVEREKTAEAVFKRMGESLLQPKLDGLRAQIHKTSDGKVEIYSRNMERLTHSFPDLVEATKKLKAKSIILDSEAIGFDFDTGTFLSFQETITRRRKHDVEDAAENIPMKAMAFDVLYLDGEDLSQEPVEERTEVLKEVLNNSKQKSIELLETVRIKTEEELEEYFQEQISEGLEGIIIKKLGTAYEPGTRNFDWIKYKANTQSEMVDTVDTVVLGYYAGRGVRAKFGIGALLVGVYNEKENRFESVAKVGTGMKDDDWIRIKKDLEPLEVKTQPKNVEVFNSNKPTVWVKPEIVMEIDADEITRSPNHTAAKDVPADFEKETKDRGLSLRFPRMKVWKRDKKAEQATTVKELVRMYQLRKSPK